MILFVNLEKKERKLQKKAYKSYKHRLHRTRTIGIWAAVVLVLAIVCNALAPMFSSLFEVLGSQKYTDTGAQADAAREAGYALSTEICEEGFVLLKNDNGLLPLKENAKLREVVAVIGLVCCAAVILWMVRLAKNAPREAVIRVAATLFFVIFAEIIVINIVKIPWGRARMRLVANDPRAYFMPWWQTGSGLKDTLVAAGVASEEFKSFPSGHTGNAATLILLGLLPQLNSRLEKKKPLLLGIGFGWAALVAFSRIIMGAHYLTDTTIGFTITLLVSCLVTKLVYHKEAALK